MWPIFRVRVLGFRDTKAAGGRGAEEKLGSGEERSRLDSQLESAVVGADKLSCRSRMNSMAVPTGCEPRCKYRSR